MEDHHRRDTKPVAAASPPLVIREPHGRRTYIRFTAAGEARIRAAYAHGHPPTGGISALARELEVPIQRIYTWARHHGFTRSGAAERGPQQPRMCSCCGIRSVPPRPINGVQLRMLCWICFTSESDEGEAVKCHWDR